MSGGLPVRLGLLGCGWIAGCRLRQIEGAGMAIVTLVADSDPAARERIRPLAPHARLVTELSEQDLSQVDGVMISTPSALHGEQAVALLDLGVPVFVQKPLALCPDEAARLLRMARALDLPLGTDLCYRHLASAVAVREALARDDVGRIFYVEGCFHNAYRPGSGWSHEPSLAGGGCLMDLGIHLVDLVMWLSGEPLALEQARLFTRGHARQPGEVEDFAAIDLSSPDGVAVRLAVSWDACTGRDAEIGLRMFGERGSLQIANRDGSFFDFDAYRFRGTEAEHLAEDRGDGWQAGPLVEWLQALGGGRGYREPLLVEEPLALVHRAYARERRGAPAAWVRDTTVHLVDEKGVLP